MAAKKEYDNATELSRTEGSSGKFAKAGDDWVERPNYGLPKRVITDGFVCGCIEGHLAGNGEPANGVVEAEYMCSFGLSYYLSFQVHEKKKVSPRSTDKKLDKFGNLTEDSGFAATELETM